MKITTKLLLFAGLLCSACSAPGASMQPSDDSTTSEGGEAQVCGDGDAVGLEVGQCAPEFSLPNAQAELVSLSSFRGKVALVDISAIW